MLLDVDHRASLLYENNGGKKGMGVITRKVKGNILMLLAAMPIMLIVLAGHAFAVDLVPAPTIAVSGTVQAQCGSAVDGVMDINIDPSAAGAQPMNVTTPATVKCSNNRAVTVSAASAGSGLSSGTGNLTGTMINGANTINYTLVFNNNLTGQGFGAGTDMLILVSGSVAQADAENAVYVVGSYTDTVTLTITY
jgi:spore coat protein U-like protein